MGFRAYLRIIRLFQNPTFSLNLDSCKAKIVLIKKKGFLGP